MPAAAGHLDGVLQLVDDEAEALACGLLGAGQVDDEDGPAQGGGPSREHGARRDAQRLRADVLGDAGRGTVAGDRGGLGRDVAWTEAGAAARQDHVLSLIHISEPTRLGMISYAVFCLKKKK